MAFENQMIPEGPAVIYTEDFRLYVEAHLTYLRTHPSTTHKPVNKELQYKNLGDLFSYLLDFDKGIEPMYHHFIMRMSGMTTQFEFNDQEWLLIPDQSIVNKLIQIYQNAEGRL